MTVSVARRSYQRLTAGIGLVALAAVTLAGCHGNLRDAVALGRDSHGGVDIRICTSLEVELVVVYQRVNGTWQETLKGEGSTPFYPGDRIEPRDRPGMEIDATAGFDTSQDGEILVQVVGEDRSIEAEFPPVRVDGLPENMWLRTDGSLESQPCQ